MPDTVFPVWGSVKPVTDNPETVTAGVVVVKACALGVLAIGSASTSSTDRHATSIFLLCIAHASE